MNRLRYLGYTIAFQEIPDEVSLVINVSGCPHKCEGCHSPQLWEYQGAYVSYDIRDLIDTYSEMITCVCFMGGDQNIEELNELLAIVKTNNLKTCVYSGADEIGIFDLKLLDYLKIGHYSKKYGGLDCPETNQRFFAVQDCKLVDKTSLFSALV